jgi:hypothetical protein
MKAEYKRMANSCSAPGEVYGPGEQKEWPAFRHKRIEEEKMVLAIFPTSSKKVF